MWQGGNWGRGACGRGGGLEWVNVVMHFRFNANAGGGLMHFKAAKAGGGAGRPVGVPPAAGGQVGPLSDNDDDGQAGVTT